MSLPVFILPEAEADLAATRAYLLRVHAEDAAARYFEPSGEKPDAEDA